MKLIREIYDSGISSHHHSDKPYGVRKASRAIVLNERDEAALLHVTADGYYKLPGGGIEAGESIEEALKREVLEEVGVSIEIHDEIGMIIEYREQFNQLQISYCYSARVQGDHSVPSFTATEQEKGFKLCWFDLEECIQLMQRNKPEQYVGSFIVSRDLAFLEEARRMRGEWRE